MLIFNIMMSRDMGGIQQAYVDFSEALILAGHEVVNISSIKALINNNLTPNYKLYNIAPWCFFSKFKLKQLINKYRPNLIICHGDRAINFAHSANHSSVSKLIGISHNYGVKKLIKCDYIISLTKKLADNLRKNNIPDHKILYSSNMIRIKNSYIKHDFNEIVTIGSIGRFVEKKGYKYLIDAINILKIEGLDIKLIIGGDGSERINLEKQVIKLGLEKNIEFSGWVDDKDTFFKKLDIFCLPSTDEPFGIILLEAMERSRVIIATCSGGPEEIIRDNQDGLIVDVKSSIDIAQKIKILIQNPDFSKKLTKSAYERLEAKYDIHKVSQNLSKILENVA